MRTGRGGREIDKDLTHGDCLRWRAGGDCSLGVGECQDSRLAVHGLLSRRCDWSVGRQRVFTVGIQVGWIQELLIHPYA